MTGLDTSALAHLLVADTGSDQVLALVRSGVALFGSSLFIAELLRVATRHGLGCAGARVRGCAGARVRGCAGAERILRRVRLLTVDDTVLREAGRLSLPGCLVRTADAIHLVTAVRLQQSAFMTDDRVQARAAEVMGLVVQSPAPDDGWWR